MIILRHQILCSFGVLGCGVAGSCRSWRNENAPFDLDDCSFDDVLLSRGKKAILSDIKIVDSRPHGHCHLMNDNHNQGNCFCCQLFYPQADKRQ